MGSPEAGAYAAGAYCMTIKAELANAVYSMLEALTVFHDHTGLVSAIGPLRAAQFNGYLRQAASTAFIRSMRSWSTTPS